MDITTILIALIIGCTAITVFSLMALLYVRRRERERDNKDTERITKTIEDLDTALNAALEEINKLGALVQKEVDEKYKSVLFLYSLVEDKQKEIEESTDSEVISDMISQFIDKHSIKLRVDKPDDTTEPATKKPSGKSSGKPSEKPKPKNPKFTNPKHKQIWEMRESGQNVSDIAKELSMGQGEVKLILDLVERAS